MVLTRLARDGSFIFGCYIKCLVPRNTGNKEEKEDEGEGYLNVRHHTACAESVLQFFNELF